MVVEKKKMVERNKPRFLRRDWHKKIKLGRELKKVRKWRAAKGRHNKIRLGMKGHSLRPKIGWGAPRENRKLIIENRMRVMNVKDLADAKKGQGILIGAVGMKKRKEIIAEANKIGLKIMNRYLVKKENEPRADAGGRGLGDKKKLENKDKGTPLDSLRHQTGQGVKK